MKIPRLFRDKRAELPKQMVGIFIVLAIGVMVAMNLLGPIFSAANTTGETIKLYGNPIATASITLGYLVGFVFVAGVIVYIVKIVIE